MTKKEIEKALKNATTSNKAVKRDASKLPKKDGTKKTTPQPRQKTVKQKGALTKNDQ